MTWGRKFSVAIFACFSLFHANSVFSSEITPLYFNQGASDSEENKQWQDLIKYKLWGTGTDGEGVVFANQDIEITDSVGYTGSAKGGFRIVNDKHRIGGPLSFGGNFVNGTGMDSILTGPSHFGGTISIDQNAWNNNNVFWAGIVCSDANGYQNTDRAFSQGNATQNCDHQKLPQIDENLDVPSVDWDYDFDRVIEGNWVFDSSSNVAGRKVSMIEIPMGAGDFYDIHVTGDMELRDGCDTLYIDNPAKRYVRIFIEGGLTIQSAMHNIVVRDMNGTVSNSNYAGNLLFYTPQSISFPAQECVYQGTFISGGTIKFMQHYHFAGQLLAKKISIDAHFRAGDFRYVPFRPPVIGMDVDSKAYEDNEVRGDTVKLTLSKEPPTSVTFNYCFSIKDANSCDGYKDDEFCEWANVNDLTAASLAGLPLCGRDTSRAEFEKGSTTLKDPIIFHAKDDPYEEDDERVVVKIFNLTAAITPNGARNPDSSYSMNYVIVDNDKRPVSMDTTVISKVNEVLTISSFPSYALDSITPLKTYDVVITALPDSGQLAYNGIPVSVGDVIEAKPTTSNPTTGIISGLTYTPLNGSYGMPYAKIGFDICKAGNPELCDQGKTMTINVINIQYTIREGAPIDTLIGTLDDMRIPGPLTCTVSAGDAGSTFKFDTTSLVLNSSLDFETKPSYSFLVKCTNTTAEDSSIVSLFVLDENEPPTIRDTVFHVQENLPVGSIVDVMPVTDEDKNPDFLKNTLSLIGGDVDKYQIDDSTGVITTKVKLDYESDKFDTVVVLVEDPDGNKDTATVVIVIDNEVETSFITIDSVQTPEADTVWRFPKDTIYTNKTELLVSWSADDIPQSDTLVKDLHEGYNTIQLTYFDETKDEGTIATLIIFVCTRTPKVEVAVDIEPPPADNIYMIIEQVPESDTSYYVNKPENVILVDIQEPILDATYTDSTCNYKQTKISIEATFDTLKVATSAYKKMEKILDTRLLLDINPDKPAKEVKANDSLTLVEYFTEVDGEKVKVSYYIDSKGDVIQNDSGTEVMTVSYETTDESGRKVTISYQADAVTGKLLEQWNGGTYIVTYPYTDKSGKTLDISYFVDSEGNVIKNEEGNTGFEVAYEYTTKEFGNTCRRTVFVVLDTVLPVVEIITPENEAIFTTNFVDVAWAVNNIEQDSLNMQGLEKGANAIVRFYRDKAGNMVGDTIVVVMKNAKEMDISIEQPVTIVTLDRIDEYYSNSKGPEENQTFAVSVYNHAKSSEEEVLIGGDMDPKEGSGEEPYPGKEDHLGPTVTIDVKMPMAGGNVGGLATFDDLLSSDGMVSLDRVDASGGQKMTPSQYIAEYCTAEFQEAFSGDYSRLNLYETTLSVHIWIYTNLGNYVDDYTFDVDLNNPDYVNKGGMLSLSYEQKPDLNGYIHTKNGRKVGTGAYLYKVDATMRSDLRCTLPPISEDIPSTNKKGATRKTSDEMLRPFGYKRPNMK